MAAVRAIARDCGDPGLEAAVRFWRAANRPGPHSTLEMVLAWLVERELERVAGEYASAGIEPPDALREARLVGD